MKKNIKTLGLVALLVGSLLMSFVIPAMAVTPPWMFAKQEESGGGGGDPRVQPSIPCGTIFRATTPLPDYGDEVIVMTYYRSCYPCGTYRSGNPPCWSECNPDLKQVY